MAQETAKQSRLKDIEIKKRNILFKTISYKILSQGNKFLKIAVKFNMKLQTTVKEILSKKGNEVFYISPENSVLQALQLMSEKDVGALLVVDQEKKVLGIFSERDYARKCILEGKSSKDTKVSELMVTKVYFITPEDKVEDVMTLMTEKKIRHLPVFDGNELVGIISIGDVVKSIIEDKDFIIKNLERYIKSG